MPAIKRQVRVPISIASPSRFDQRASWSVTALFKLHLFYSYSYEACTPSPVLRTSLLSKSLLCFERTPAQSFDSADMTSTCEIRLMARGSSLMENTHRKCLHNHTGFGPSHRGKGITCRQRAARLESTLTVASMKKTPGQMDCSFSDRRVRGRVLGIALLTRVSDHAMCTRCR